MSIIASVQNLHLDYAQGRGAAIVTVASFSGNISRHLCRAFAMAMTQ